MLISEIKDPKIRRLAEIRFAENPQPGRHRRFGFKWSASQEGLDFWGYVYWGNYEAARKLQPADYIDEHGILEPQIHHFYPGERIRVTKGESCSYGQFFGQILEFIEWCDVGTETLGRFKNEDKENVRVWINKKKHPEWNIEFERLDVVGIDMASGMESKATDNHIHRTYDDQTVDAGCIGINFLKCEICGEDLHLLKKHICKPTDSVFKAEYTKTKRVFKVLLNTSEEKEEFTLPGGHKSLSERYDAKIAAEKAERMKPFGDAGNSNWMGWQDTKHGEDR